MNRYFVVIRQLSKAIMIIFGIGIALPLIIGFIFGIPPGKILALVGSTLALQATASPVGVGLGLPRNHNSCNDMFCLGNGHRDL